MALQLERSIRQGLFLVRAHKTHRIICNILAAGIDNSTIRLFDIRTFDKGPYVSWHIPKTSDAVWTNLEFSADGTQVLFELLLFFFTFVLDSYNDKWRNAENYRCV